jgi:hypothetical protein
LAKPEKNSIPDFIFSIFISSSKLAPAQKVRLPPDLRTITFI